MGLKILQHWLYFLHGFENVALIWKYKTSITSPGVQVICPVGLIGMAKKAVNIYSVDNSGILPTPTKDSSVAPLNKIDLLTHTGFHKLLTREGLSNLYKRWSKVSMLDWIRYG